MVRAQLRRNLQQNPQIIRWNVRCFWKILIVGWRMVAQQRGEKYEKPGFRFGSSLHSNTRQRVMEKRRRN
jgi:hypothetical protein